MRPSARPFTAEEDAKLRILIAEGTRRPDIAKILGRDSSTIGWRMRRLARVDAEAL